MGELVNARLAALRSRGWLAAARALALVLVGLGSAAVAWRSRGSLDPVALSAAIGRYPAAPLAFLAIQLAASLLFVPRTLLALAAGLVFGMGWGLVWAAAGGALGSIAGFLLARFVNGGLIELESLRRIGPYLERAERGGWRTVAALRLIPVIPHTLANYAFGLSRVPLLPYAIGSLLGQLPLTVAYVDLGAAGGRALSHGADWTLPTAIGAAALALSLFFPAFARLRARRSAEQRG
jgi:uncharacterized membrane protein YdjX (TVP38/TMEM64 family)